MSDGVRVVVTGAAGQLGQALQASLPQGIELIALTRQGLDLADAKACASLVRELPSDLLVPLSLRKPDGLHPRIRLEIWSEFQGWTRWIRQCLYRQQKPTWPAWCRRRKQARWFTFHAMASLWPF